MSKVIALCLLLGFASCLLGFAEGFTLLGRHSTTTQILEDISSHHDQQVIKEGLTEIRKLAAEIKHEEDKLAAMIQERDALKTTFWWFLDTDIVLALEAEQLKINDQDRIIQNKFEDAVYHWKKLKPAFGVQSTVFVSELISSFLSIFSTLFHMFFGFAEFTLISFLFFGPIVFALWTLLTAIGFRLIPISLTIYWLIWVARLPFILIQYKPSAVEFIIVYGFSVLLAGVSCWVVLSPLRPRKIKIQ